MGSLLSLFVDVAVDPKKRRKLSADLKQIEKEASKDVEMNVGADTSGLGRAKAQITGLRKEGAAGVTVGVEADSADIELTRTALRNFRREAANEVEVTVSARTGDAMQRLGAVASLRRDVNGNAVVNVDADTASALAGMNMTRQAADSLDGRGVSMGVDADTGGAMANLRGVDSAASQLDGREIDIRTDKSRSGLSMLSSVMSGVAGAVRGMDAGLSAGGVRIAMIGGIAATAAALFTPLLGALASVGALGVAAGAGIGLIAAPLLMATSKLSDYHDALTKLNDLQASGTATSEQLAEAQKELALASEGVPPALIKMYNAAMRFKAAGDTAFIPSQIAVSKLATRILGDVIPAFGILNRTSVASIGALGKAWDGFLSRLKMPTQQASVGTLLGITPQVVQSLTSAVGDFALALTNLLAAAAPSAVKLADAFESAMRAFLEWSGSTQAIEGVKTSIAAAVPVFQALWDMVKQVGGALFEFGATNAPAIATAIDWVSTALTAVIDGFSWLTRMFGPIVPIVAALTPIFLGLALIFGQVGSFIVSLVSGVGLLWGAFGTLAIALGIGVAPLAAIVAGVVALAAGFVYAYKNSEAFRNGVNAVAGAVKDVLLRAFENFMDVATPVWNFIKDLGGAMLSNAAEKLGEIGSAIAGIFGDEKTKSAAKDIKDALTPPEDSAWSKLKTAVSEFFQTVRDEADKEGSKTNVFWKNLTDDKGAIDSLKAKWNGVKNWLKENGAMPGLNNIWKGLSDDKGAIDSLKAKWNGIKNWMRESGATAGFANIWKGLSDDKGAIDKVKLRWGQFKTWLRDSAASIVPPSIWKKLTDDQGAIDRVKIRWQQFKTWLSGAMQIPGVQNIWTKLTDDEGAFDRIRARWQQLRTFASSTWQSITQTVGNAWQGITSRVQSAVQNVQTRVQGAWTRIRTATTSAFNAVRSTITSVWQRILGAVISVIQRVVGSVTQGWNRIRTTTTAVFNTVRNFLSAVWQAIWTRIQQIAQRIWQTLNQAWTRIKTSTQAAFDIVKSYIEDKLSAARDRAGEIVSNLVSGLKEKYEELKRGTDAAFNAIRDFMADPIEAARDRIRSALTAVIGIVNGVLKAFGQKTISVDFGGGGSGKSPAPPDSGGINRRGLARGGVTTDPDYGRAFRRGGVAFERGGKGGMGTQANRPRVHMWNEQMGPEGYAVKNRPSREQLPYIREMAGWHGHDLLPRRLNKPSHRGGSDLTEFHEAHSGHRHARGGIAGGFVRAFKYGGFGKEYFNSAASALDKEVMSRFPVDGSSYAGHPAGAVDFLVSSGQAQGQEKALGDAVAGWLDSNYNALNLRALIWYARARYEGGPWQPYVDNYGGGSSDYASQMHYNHPHAESLSGAFGKLNEERTKGFTGGGGGGFGSGPSLADQIWSGGGNPPGNWQEAVKKSIVDTAIKSIPIIGGLLSVAKNAFPGLEKLLPGEPGKLVGGFGGGLIGERTAEYLGGYKPWVKDYIYDKFGSVGGDGGGVSGNFTGSQKEVALTFAKNAKGRGIPGRLPVMTALVESGMKNLGYGDRDSLGYFQQRPSQGWGSPEQIMDPAYSLGKFLDGAEGYKGQYSNSPSGLGAWAQAVQRSAFPDRYAGEWDNAASLIGDPKFYSEGGMAIRPQIAEFGERGKEIFLPLDNAQVMRSAQTALGTAELRAEVQRLTSVVEAGLNVNVRDFGEPATEKMIGNGRAGAREVMAGTEGQRIVRSHGERHEKVGNINGRR